MAGFTVGNDSYVLLEGQPIFNSSAVNTFSTKVQFNNIIQFTGTTSGITVQAIYASTNGIILNSPSGQAIAAFTSNGGGAAFEITASGSLDKFAGLSVVGLGVPGIVASFSSNEIASLVSNAINYTPPATAGTYRLNVLIRVTATGVATSLGWTIAFKDGNSNTVSMTDFPMVREGQTALTTPPFLNIGATFLNLSLIFAIDNSATAITFSTTGTATGTNYWLAATLEQLA